MDASKIRVALFVPSMRGGGAERVMLNLAIGIAKKGYAVDLVLAKAEGMYLTQIPDVIRIIDLNASRVLASLLKLVMYLRREKPDALLSAMSHTNIIALWARRISNISTRIVVSEHITLSQVVKNKASWRVRLISRFLIRWFYSWADAVVAVSNEMAEDFQNLTGIPSNHIKVIYNPVVTPELQKKARANLRHPWLEPKQPPVILAVGRLNMQKDFSTLIQSFALVRRDYLAHLLILGEGEERSNLEDLIKQLQLDRDVSMPGFVENPYPYMSQADIFVLSSRWEGLPTVLIEALYCGTPIVSTDCPSGTREILLDGQFGQLVPVGDIKALAEAIKTKLGTQATHPPQESWLPFDMDTVVPQYLEVLLNDYA